jgi:hypothetical protein
MKAMSPRRAVTPIVLLVGLLVCAFVLEGAQPQHIHRTSQPGLYNAECPLALASLVRTDGWAPTPLSVAALAFIVSLVLPRLPERISTCSLTVRSSRAPPLV